MSETKAATESQLAKQRARNAMPEEARGRWRKRGERERESWWKGKRKDGEWLVVSLADYSSSFFHFLPPFDIPLFFAFSRAQTRGGGKGRPRSRASVYLPWPNAIVCSPTRHTLVCIFSMAATDGISFDCRVDDRMDPPVAGSSNVYIDRIKFSNRNNCFDNVTYV